MLFSGFPYQNNQTKSWIKGWLRSSGKSPGDELREERQQEGGDTDESPDHPDLAAERLNREVTRTRIPHARTI